jgi:1,4-alpha-glucan branching enzyme
MSFSNREQGHHHKEALLPRARDIDALVRAEHHDPFAILGPHGDGAGGQYIRAYLPDALSVQVVARESGEELGNLEATQTPGLFVGHFERTQPYLLRTRWAGGEQISEDPYSFGPLLGDMDLYLFAEGNHRDLSSALGAQLKTVDGVEGVRFAVWAPNARRVSVIGDFNVWDGRSHPMRQRHRTGVWELFIPGIVAGTVTSTKSSARKAIRIEKADPVARATEPAAGSTAKVVGDRGRLRRTDEQWMLSARRSQAPDRAAVDLRNARRLLAMRAGRSRRSGPPVHLARTGRAADSLCRSWASPTSN